MVVKDKRLATARAKVKAHTKKSVAITGREKAEAGAKVVVESVSSFSNSLKRGSAEPRKVSSHHQKALASKIKNKQFGKGLNW